MLLMIWGGIGIAVLVWALAASMVPQGKPRPAGDISRALLVGEMRDFEPAFPPRGSPLTRFQGPAGDMTLADFRGQVVLVNLWATWCPPCVEELPALDRLQAEMGGDDFTVVAIAAEPRINERGPPFFRRLEISHLALYSDPRLEFANNLGAANTLPISILYDAQGNEVGRLNMAAEWDSEEAKALIRAVIAGETVS